jgi:PHD/YefM family antitoxin component YafN of YafNO toxin-antitoxin module
VVTRHGKPVAVLLSIEDEEELERLVLTYTPKFQGILEAAREQIRETGGIGHEEFWQEMEAETS